MTILLWSLHLMVLFSLYWWVYHRCRSSHIRQYFWAALGVKLVAGVVFGLLYRSYFSGDTWTYFENAITLLNWAQEFPGAYFHALLGADLPDTLMHEMGYEGHPRALFMTKITSVVAFIAGHNYWISSLYFSSFSFLGLWWLTHGIALNYPASRKAAVFAFLFLPSMVFWSTGISKEAIYAGGMGFFIIWSWPYFKSARAPGPARLVILVLLVLLLFNLKYYYVAVLLPVVLASVAVEVVSSRTRVKWLKRPLVWVLFFLVLVLPLSLWHPNLSWTLIDVIRNNAQIIAARSSETALIHYLQYDHPVVWMLVNAPLALVTGLLRPHFGDWGSMFQNLAIAENLFITGMLVGRLKYLSRIDWRTPWLLPVSCYILVLCILLSLSTPNFGTLGRFKIAYLPFFLLLVLSNNPWWEKLSKPLP